MGKRHHSPSSRQREQIERERLLEESRQIIHGMRLKRINHILLALGAYGLPMFAVWLMRRNGASKSSLNAFASGVMTINGLVSMYLLVEPLLVSRSAIRAMKRGMEDLCEGKFSSNEEYEEKFLGEAKHFLSRTFPYFLFTLKL